MERRLLVYGANGYTGRLVVSACLDAGLLPILAGRDSASLDGMGRSLGLERRVFALDDERVVLAGVAGIHVLLNCAGPFVRTARTLAEACLHCGSHYLDITGEWPVFEELAGMDDEARRRRVMLLPGAGFDVVPTDAVACHLKQRLPTASHLELALLMLGGLSHGSAVTMAEQFSSGGRLRRAGELVEVPLGSPRRMVDFGRGPVRCVALPWGDVSSAYRSTGIPNIVVYGAVPPRLANFLSVARRTSWILGRRVVGGWLRAQIDGRGADPSPGERARGRAFVWGRVHDDFGREAVTLLRTPEAYTFTALAAAALAKRAFAGDAPHGYRTPASAYGPDVVLGLDRVVREDVALVQTA